MGHRRQLALVLLAVLLAAAPAPAQENAATGGDDAATRQYDFANGLYVRGEAFCGQAAEQYRIFLRDYPDDERCDEALYRLGECTRNDGKLHEALKTFREHARRFPTSDNADRTALRTGQVLDELGKHAEAIAVFGRIAESGAAAEFKQAARYRLAKTLLDNNQTNEALEVFGAIADSENDRFRPYALYQLGVMHAERGEDDLAVKRLRELARLSVEFAPEALFRVGEIDFKRERYTEAAAAYRQVAAKHTQSDYAGAAAYGLVQSLVRAGRYEDAIAAYELVRDLVPEPVRPQTSYLVGNAHYELGRHDTAFKLYEAVARAAPNTELGVKAELKMAWCRYFLKDFDGLAAAATTFLNEHPRHPDADTVHYLAGEALLQLKRPQDALLHYETILNDFAGSAVLAEAEFKIGWCLFEQENYEAARAKFLAFADARPDDARAAEAIARAAECSVKLVKMHDAVSDYRRLLDGYSTSKLAEGALYQLGLAYVSLDEQDKAVATFLDFVERYPESVHASDAYYWIGSQKHKAGELDEAITYLERSIETATESGFVERASYKLAIIRHGRGEFDQAAAILLAMLRKNENADVPAKTYLWAAGYLLEHEQVGDATFLYKSFFEKLPEGPAYEEAHFGLGECLARQEQWDKALGHYRKAVAHGGSLTLLAKLHAGIALHKLGKDDEAVAQLMPLLKAEEPAIEAETLYWLGTVYFLQAHKTADAATAAALYDKAKSQFLRVVILYGNAERRPECMLRTAECHAALGQTDEADKQHRELIETYPDSPFAEQAREAVGPLDKQPEPPAEAGDVKPGDNEVEP